MPIDPVANGLNPAVPLAESTEYPGRQLDETVRLAIAAGIDIAHHFGRNIPHWHFGDLRRVGKVVHEINRGRVGKLQLARFCANIKVTIAGDRIRMHPLRDGLAQGQAFVRNCLVRRVHRMDVEHEIGATPVDLVVQINLQLDLDHGAGNSSISLQPAPPADQVDQDHDDGEDHENMDKTSQGVGGDESENPQYKQYNSDRIKHGIPLRYSSSPALADATHSAGCGPRHPVTARSRQRTN